MNAHAMRVWLSSFEHMKTPHMIDDANPLVAPIKDAFYARATVFAAQLQQEVDADRMTPADAQRRLVEIMARPAMLEAVLADSQAGMTAH